MNLRPVTLETAASVHCAPRAHWHSSVNRSLLLRHVVNKQPFRGTVLPDGERNVHCCQAAVSDLEDVDPVTGEVVSSVKSKVPKYASIILTARTQKPASHNMHTSMHVTGSL